MKPPRFLDPLRVEQIDWVNGRPEWRTLSRLRYISERLGGEVEVPAEFDFDEASVPRLPLIWLVAGGRGKAASAVHDYGYQRGGLVVDGVFRVLARSEIDAVFFEAMAADPMSGTSAAARWLMWSGVRAGGWYAWKRQAPRSKSLNPAWTREGWPEAP